MGHGAVAGDDPGDTVGRGHHDRPPQLNCPSPSDLELLLGLDGSGEGGVAGLHHHDLSTASDLPGKDVVVGNVEADRVSHQQTVHRQWSLALAGEYVTWDAVEPRRPTADHRPPRNVLPEGHRMRLRIHPAPADLGSAVGSPEKSAVVGRLSGRAVEDPPDQHGNAHGGHGLLDPHARNRVADRIDGGSILRPHHQRERLPLIGGEAVGERGGRLDVVAGDRPVMARQIPAITGNAALDRGHCRRCTGRDLVGPDRPGENGRAYARQHSGGRGATQR